MSMMESMRSGSNSTVMQLVFFAVIVSFVGWGVGVSGNKSGSVATVNGEAISDVDFSQAYRTAENQMSRRATTPMTEDQRAALHERVMQELIRRSALLQEAQSLGLEVSSKEIAESLMQIPFLLDDQGVFDKVAYFNFLRQRGTTRANFEEQIRDDLLVRKLQELMILGASVSDATVQQRYIDANTLVDVQFVRIRPGQFQATISPSPEELEKFSADHKDEIRARYDDDLATKYDLPETVDVRLIRLPVRDDGLGIAELKAKLEAVRKQAEAGADLGELARRWSEDPSAKDGGLVEGQRKADLDAALADAVSKLQPGQLGDLLVRDADVRLVRLEARKDARRIPFEEVEHDIAARLFVETEAPTRAAAFAEKELLPAWKAAGAPPEALLATHELQVQSTGPTSSMTSGLMRPPEGMMAAARVAKVGDVLPEVYEEDGTLWVGALLSREDADMTKFDAEKTQIREQALLARRFEFFQDWVDDVVARADVKR